MKLLNFCHLAAFLFMCVFISRTVYADNYFTYMCSGLMEPDTLMRDNKRQSERCHHESKTNA